MNFISATVVGINPSNLVNRIVTPVKNLVKSSVRMVFNLFKISVIFRGERTEQGLFPYFIQFFLSQCHGILHVGAHYGQESVYYASFNKPVLWIEADPQAFKILSNQISLMENQRAINALVSDSIREEYLHITSNYGMSSSVHPLSNLGEQVFHLKNTHSIKLWTNTLNQILKSEKNNLDFWVIDVQGHEFEVLRGSDQVIHKARWVLVEGSNVTFYEGMSLFPKVKELLENLGFFLIYCPAEALHFEAFFINKINNIGITNQEVLS